MIRKINFEPIYELFSKQIAWKTKKVRFFGRIPFFRKLGFSSIPIGILDSGSLRTCSTGKDIPQILSELNEKAFCDGIFLKPDTMLTISDEFNNLSFKSRDVAKESREFSGLSLDGSENPGEVNVYASQNPHLLIPILKDIAHHDLTPIAASYLGAKPCLMNTAIILTFPGGADDNPDFGFHYDVDDFRFLKVFFYLTDVDMDGGAHEVILKSHKYKKSFFKFFNRRLSKVPEDLRASVHTIIGKKGFGFFEDTFCYHRGTAPSPSRHRVMLQFEFGISC
tara:strand:+ start:137 stop:976 length:840 start_codon:yes stop_codon:yes gene_type:complete